MDSKLIEQINELLLNGRSQLQKEAASDIKNKLIAKRENLKENFIVNLPSNYNNEKELLELFVRIESLKTNLQKLKSENASLSTVLKKKKENKPGNDIANELNPLVVSSIQLKRQLCYTSCLIRIEELNFTLDLNLQKLNQSLSKKIEKPALNDKKTEKNDWYVHVYEQNKLFEDTITSYLELKNLLETISDTQCIKLLNYLITSMENYHEKLKIIITNELEDKLKSIAYPFIASALPDNEKKPLKTKAQILANEIHEAQLKSTKEQNEMKIKLCIDWLLQIDFNHLLTNIISITNKPLIYSNKTVVVSILTSPLEKRFRFHFSGSRKTNNLEKPEWYLSQILKWIKIHEEFLIIFIQPIFDKHNAYKGKPIIIDFVNCFINLIKKKIDLDLPLLIKDKFQFSHTIDELLLFDVQLKNYLKEQMVYDNEIFTSCMNILCGNEEFFFSWLNLERLLCTKKIDQMFAYLNRTNLVSLDSNEGSTQSTQTMFSLNEEKNYYDIWQCNYSDVDKMKPPHCAETFMSMIKAISDRFSELSHHQSKKLKFVSLQIELVNDFHMRLCQIIRDEVKAPFGKVYLGALNAINYIINIIDEWKNSTFYIEMHYVKSKFDQFINKNKAAKQGIKFDLITEENELETEFDLCKQFDAQFLNNETSFYNLNSLFDLNGTLFDDVLSSYEKIKDEMLSTIIQNCLWEIKTRSRNYKKEKWISMPLFSDYYKTTLTQSAADMLISLKNLLNLLKESLACYLFESVVKKIAAELDKFFYEDIILKNQFNDGGVSQFDHDFNKYLLPILNEYTINDSISDSFFRKTKEALVLLKLKQGPAILIKEIIYSALHSDSSSNSDLIKLRLSTSSRSKENSVDDKRIQLYNARNALKEFGVVQLTCEQAEEILHLRFYGETI